MMSVPPVLPPQLKAMPSPAPHITEPMRQAIVSCPGPSSWGKVPSGFFTSHWVNSSIKVSTMMANVVLMLNLGPSTLMASVISTALMMKYVYWMGKPVE